MHNFVLLLGGFVPLRDDYFSSRRKDAKRRRDVLSFFRIYDTFVAARQVNQAVFD
jgi:hypothetical protein